MYIYILRNSRIQKCGLVRASCVVKAKNRWIRIDGVDDYSSEPTGPQPIFPASILLVAARYALDACSWCLWQGAPESLVLFSLPRWLLLGPLLPAVLEISERATLANPAASTHGTKQRTFREYWCP
mmetsp:Transcript_87074/g.177406  ORF Transcript_87074/g.177406 Transcript_87074/m.177406 type:complete len:126 (-) Transcript_87074:341-718(-)